ncbi:Uncharacterised protein [Leminorella richardii]|uniref:YcxB-like protein domain-containing protein n=1 Tax=Leminorella richardii TaxID=158841 RepID=A0A2X4XUS3_9GAMM|nr:hypothetical protein [Leminorella richardii]SQI40434.1 Uncharacterised protein [Leminorella richardii]
MTHQENGQRNDVRFRIEIPANALSYKEYIRSSSRAVSSIASANPRKLLSRLKGAAGGFIFTLAAIVGFQLLSEYSGIKLFAAVWSEAREDYLYYTDSAFSLCLVLLFLGGFAGMLWLGKLLRQQGRIVYRNNTSIRDGYLLELTENGICATNLKHSESEHWRIDFGWGKVSGVVSDSGVDIILFNSAVFLWIPEWAEGYSRSEVLAFIEAKRRA